MLRFAGSGESCSILIVSMVILRPFYTVNWPVINRFYAAFPTNPGFYTLATPSTPKT
jgi:hypothetical protein